jgi:ribosomal protein S18 acetylase RimI-like enzyme
MRGMGGREPREIPKPSGLLIRPATMADIAKCKSIADNHRNALGFLTRAVFSEAATRGCLLVADLGAGNVAGFVRFNHRKHGTETAIYDVCVAENAQRQGIGRALILAVAAECRKFDRSSIVLRCPEDLDANGFYQQVGFEKIDAQEGRRRLLVVWRLKVEND